VQQIASAEQQRNAAARYFNYLLGREAETAIDALNDSLLVRTVDIPVQELVSRALRAREEIGQAHWGIEAYEAQAQLARSSYLPAISLAVDYGVQGNDYRFDSRNDVAVASLVFSWNIFNGGQDRARREQAALDVQRGKVGKRQAEQQIELQVRQSYDALAVAGKSMGAASDRLNAARRSFELMRRRYLEGVASQLEFTDARTSLTNAELNWILTRYQHIANYIELERVAALRSLDLEGMERSGK
jgi:outer membrane protein TolC